MGRRPFWKTARVLLRFKPLLAIALLGALVSAACFGAGMGMVLPVLKLMLAEGKPLGEWVIAGTAGGHFAAFGQWLAQHIPQQRFEAFCAVMLLVGVLVMIGSMGRFVHELLIITVVQRAVMVWRRRLYRRMLRVPMRLALQVGSADQISRIVMDTRFMASGYTAILGKAVTKIFNAAAALMIALTLDWVLTSMALICAPVMTILLRKFGKVIRRTSRRALHMRGRMFAVLRESLGALSVIKVHNAEGQERRRFARINRGLYNEEMKMRRVKAISSPLLEALGMCAVLGVAALAAWYTFVQQRDPAQFMTVLVMLFAVVASLKPLSSLNNTLHGASAAAARVLELDALDTERDPKDAPRLPRHRSTIDLTSVSFTYPGAERPAIRDVSLHVEHGQLVAIVGGNGSGKTTLISMLPRLLEPDAGGGRVLIDGVDVAGSSLRSLRRQIGVVSQQTVLFEGKVAANIAYGRSHVRPERIVASARAARADGFILGMPDGYDTMLGEDGVGLSGGQRQRLCIARAILRDPAVLILDEATSQIDADSEAQINEALGEFRHGRTTFVIAHRLSTVIHADKIIVMHDGRLVAQGTHDELLDRSDAYRTLTRTQLQPV